MNSNSRIGIGAERGAVANRSALAKLLAAFIIALPLILTIDPVSAATALLLVIPLLALSGLSPKQFWRRTAVVWIAAPLSGITIVLYGSVNGQILWEWWLMRVSEGSILLGLATALRILAIGLPAVVFFATVDPTDLADDLAQRARLPARFVLGALAGLRMIGLLTEDWQALALARRARGVADEGRIRRSLGMAFALFVLAIRRGSALAIAMEARGFGGSTPRTWARPSQWDRRDTALLIFAAVIPAVALTASVVTGAWTPILRS